MTDDGNGKKHSPLTDPTPQRIGSPMVDLTARMLRWIAFPFENLFKKSDLPYPEGRIGKPKEPHE